MTVSPPELSGSQAERLRIFERRRQVLKWIKRLLRARPTEQHAAYSDIPGSLKVYVERRKRELFENAQRQLAASALNPTSNEETLDDRDEELKRAHHLMMQAQELFGTGNVEGAIANIKEVGRIKKRYPE